MKPHGAATVALLVLQVANGHRVGGRRLARNATVTGIGAGQPTEDMVEVYQMKVCLERMQASAQGVPCQAWMVERCRGAPPGQGYCKELKDLVAKDCSNGKAASCSFAVEFGLLRAEGAVAAVGAPSPPMAVVAASPGPATSPAPAPAAAPSYAPTGIDKSLRTLPSQGFDETSTSSVKVSDLGKSAVKDWGREWPMTDETEGQSFERICEDQPWHDWCKLYLKDRDRRKGR
mmetsp:Transcript_65308/g.181156  ORF Transcript_65308/g.181156 Transcript_65308/m.181156 type:complete len:232 (-) Transcript_65308:191-886(-)